MQLERAALWGSSLVTMQAPTAAAGPVGPYLEQARMGLLMGIHSLARSLIAVYCTDCQGHVAASS